MVAEGMIVAVFGGVGDITLGVGDGVGEAAGGGEDVIVESGDDGVNAFGKANNATLMAMTAIASNPSENRKSFQLRA
jgi:hypothetical protein